MTRFIREIARDIQTHWPRPNYAAQPYLRAMLEINTIDGAYGFDSNASIVRYFLSNAKTFTGPYARALKAELRALLNSTKEK